MKVSSIGHLLSLLWRAALAFVFLFPARAEAQDRGAATGIPSCREFSEPALTVTLTGLTDLSQLLAASWNGATKPHAEAYFNRQQPFPAPVLANGLPTRLQPSLRIGPVNWFRPGTDNEFNCEFRRDLQTESAACPGRIAAREGRFISFVDLLAANAMNRFQASVTVTETFVRPATDPAPAAPFRGGQVPRRALNQAGLLPGFVRWTYTATAMLVPDCQGRPATPVLANGVPTAEGRAYLASTCTPVDGTSIETLYNWRAVQRYPGSSLRKDYRIRALPGDIRIPRSGAFQSIAERACLALPQVAAQTDEALRCDVAPEQFTAWNRDLVPATVVGLVPGDLVAAAEAAAARLDRISQGPTCADARAVAEANAVAARSDGRATKQTLRGDRWMHTAISRGHIIVGMAVVILALLVIIIVLVVGRARKRRLDEGRERAQRAQDEERWQSERAQDGIWIRIERDLAFAFQAARQVQSFFAHGSMIAFTQDVEDALEPAKADEDPLIQAHVVNLTMQALRVYVRERAEADQAKAALAAAPSTVPLSAATPAEGITAPVGEGAYGFFRGFKDVAYSEILAGSRSEVRNILDQINKLARTSPRSEWERVGARAGQHAVDTLLRAERLELAAADLVGILQERRDKQNAPPTSRKHAVEQLAKLRTEIGVAVDVFYGSRWKGDARFRTLFDEKLSAAKVVQPTPPDAPPVQGDAPSAGS